MNSYLKSIPKELHSTILSKNTKIEDVAESAILLPEMMIAYDNQRDTRRFWKDLLLHEFGLEIEETLTIANLERIYLMLNDVSSFNRVVYLPDLLLTIRILSKSSNLHENGKIYETIHDCITIYVALCISHQKFNLLESLREIAGQTVDTALKTFAKVLFSKTDRRGLKNLTEQTKLLDYLSVKYPEVIPDTLVYRSDVATTRESVENVLKYREILKDYSIRVLLDLISSILS